MHIRTNTEIPLPWDTSSHSSNFDTSQDKVTYIINSHSSIDSQESQQPQPLCNPYISAPAPNLPTWLMTTLRSWIIPWAPPPIIPAQPILPPIKDNYWPASTSHQTYHPPYHYQSLINTDLVNQHWGNAMQCPKLFNTFRVLSWNNNTMTNNTDYLAWKAAAHAINECEADMIAFQETNLAWNKIHHKRVHQIFQALIGHVTITTSSSSKISNMAHQWGGTLQAMLGNWTSHMAQLGNDDSGLGRWSFVELQGREDQHYIILLGYWVCKNQMVDPGSNNTFN